MNAMILCAGLGTRLRPLSEWLPKPLVPIGDRPALAHIVERVRSAGAARVVVNAHHRVADLRAWLAGDARDVALSEEARLLGTAGGVARARELLGEGDVLIWNGDIDADVDLAALARAHADARCEATLVVRASASGRAGNIGLDASGRVVRMRNETAREGEATSVDFLGVHLLGKALREALPAEGDLVGDLYLPALHRGARIGVVVHAGRFFDVGTVAVYREANAAWLRERALSAWAAPSARVDASVALRDCVVGDGAVVDGRGELARCIVWPGARATAPLADAIVTPRGIVL